MKRFHACCPSHATSRFANRISVRLLLALADFSYCSSRFIFRVSFLPHSDLCSSSEMTSLLQCDSIVFVSTYTQQGGRVRFHKIFWEHHLHMIPCLEEWSEEPLFYLLDPKRWPQRPFGAIFLKFMVMVKVKVMVIRNLWNMAPQIDGLR